MDIFFFIAGMDYSAFLSGFIVILLGLFIGMLMGAIPGLGIMIAVTLLLPLSYSLSAVDSILLLLACYQGAEYGGSISAVTLGIPGTAMAAATVIDGHEYAKRKEPGKAIAYSLVSSTIGGLVGAFVLIVLSKPLTAFALQLGDPEYVLLALMGLAAVTTIGSNDKIKNLISIVLGLFVGMVGMDIFTGSPRFTGGFTELYDGFNMIALVVALFAFTEVFAMVTEDMNYKRKVKTGQLKLKLTFKEIKSVVKAMFTGSAIGAAVGIMPGLGSTASSWFGYMAAKKVSKNKEMFGKGSPEGIAGPEAANNATVGGALLPLLTLGIPGSASLAIIAGAFIIHGIQPGPQVMRENADLVNAIFVGFVFTTILMYVMGRILNTGFVRLLVTPYSFIAPGILLFSIIGIYAASGLHFDLWLALILGIVAFYLKKLDYSVYSFVLAFVLCPIIEESLRRSLDLSGGSLAIFVTRPYSVVILLIMAAIVFVPMINSFRQRKKESESRIDHTA